MDAFITGIGQRYLEGKANSVPQQLENLAKKQFSSTTDTNKQTELASTLPSNEKDKEISKLRKQLAETKVDKAKATGEAKMAKSENGKATSKTKSVESEQSKLSKKSASETKHSRSSVKEEARLKRHLVPLSIDADAAWKSPKSAKGSEAHRGRRSSASTATAASRYAESSAKGGGHSTKVGNDKGDIHGLDAMGATEALPYQTKSHKAASIAHASHHGSTTKSTGSTLRALSHRSHSAHQGSEFGSEARSTGAAVAPRPAPPPPTHYSPPRRKMICAEELRHYEVEEPDLYVVEVEEEPPRTKKGMRGRGGGGNSSLVEVQSSKGRTMYKIT